MIFFLCDATHSYQIVRGRRNRLCIIYLVGNELIILCCKINAFVSLISRSLILNCFWLSEMVVYLYNRSGTVEMVSKEK
jgi:hypothetical protein